MKGMPRYREGRKKKKKAKRGVDPLVENRGETPACRGLNVRHLGPSAGKADKGRQPVIPRSFRFSLPFLA